MKLSRPDSGPKSRRVGYYFGLWQLFMIVEDTVQHFFNWCQKYPPPIVALHLHLPHTLYCIAQSPGGGYLIPRIGISGDLLAIEPFISEYTMPLEVWRELGVLNLIIVSWSVYTSLSNRGVGRRNHLIIALVLAAVSLAVSALFGHPA